MELPVPSSEAATPIFQPAGYHDDVIVFSCHFQWLSRHRNQCKYQAHTYPPPIL